MKYIKKFESYYKDVFYKINREIPKFEISLRKIGLPQYRIDAYTPVNLNTDNKYSDSFCRFPYVYISVAYDGDGDYSFSGFMQGDDAGKNYYENIKSYEYGGEVEVTPEEIEKFKLEHEANKYNL